MGFFSQNLQVVAPLSGILPSCSYIKVNEYCLWSLNRTSTKTLTSIKKSFDINAFSSAAKAKDSIIYAASQNVKHAKKEKIIDIHLTKMKSESPIILVSERATISVKGVQ